MERKTFRKGRKIMRKTSVIKNVMAVGLVAALLTACGTSKAETLSNESTSAAFAAGAEEACVDTAGNYDGGWVLANGAKTAVQEEIAEEGSYDYAEDAVVEPEGESGYGQDTVAKAPVTSRKLIKTVDITAETEEFDTLVPGLQKQVEALGGYIESNQVYEIGSYYVDDHMEKQRCANMTARVPKEKLDGFLEQVGEQTNVTSRSETVEDVTLQYVDLESHKKALLTEQERLLELLAQAESVEDIIAIEGRLSEVRYQLESMESQLRTYDNKIDYSTVYLSIQEVRKYSAPQDASIGQRISRGFIKSLEDIGFGIQDLAIGFVIDIPYIVLGIVIIAVVVLILRKVRKVWKKHSAKREAVRGEKNPKSSKRRIQFRWPVTTGHGENVKAENGDSNTENKQKETDGE